MNNYLYVMDEIEKSKTLPSINVDYFLIAAYSSERAYKCISYLYSINVSINNVLLFDYNKFRPDAISVLYDRYKTYSEIKYKTEVLKCENDDATQLNKIPISNNSSVAIDITSFSIPDLFKIMFVLREIKKIDKIYAFYTEPKYYCFRQGLFDAYEYLIDERSYETINEYHNSGSNNEETLTLFLGFDKGTSTMVKEESKCSEVVVINGFPSISPKLKDISLLNNKKLLIELGQNNLYTAKANNPFSAYNILYDVKNKFSENLINICVLGSKPMALGACLFSLDFKKHVKVTYPFPKYYGNNISEGSSTSWFYELFFKND